MIKEIQAVSVLYHGRKVGTLSMGNRSNCQFEYDKDWLADGNCLLRQDSSRPIFSLSMVTLVFLRIVCLAAMAIICCAKY